MEEEDIEIETQETKTPNIPDEKLKGQEEDEYDFEKYYNILLKDKDKLKKEVNLDRDHLITEYSFLRTKSFKKMNSRHYHWCYKCFTKYSPYYIKNGKRYERKDKAEGHALRSRPLLMGRDKCPLIVNNQLVLKSLDSCYERIIADCNGDYYEDGLVLE